MLMMSGHSQRSESWLMSCNRSAKGGNECSDLWETTFSSLDDFGKIVLISHCMDDYPFGRAYQLPLIPWSSIIWTIIGIWKDCYFWFIYFSVMALGVLLRIDCVVAAVAPLSATCLISTGGSTSFPVNAFSVFPAISKAKTFGFWLFFSHFPTLCAVDLLLRVFCSSPPQFSP